MDNSTPAHGSVMFTNDEHVEQAAEIKRLQGLVMTGQRLLTEALNRKARAEANERRVLAQVTVMWRLLKRVRNHWTFKLLPQALRLSILEEVGNAD